MSAINYLVFGNPMREHLEFLEKETYLDSLLPELKSFAPLQNESQETFEELSYVTAQIDELASDPTKVYRYKKFDQYFEHVIYEWLVNNSNIDSEQIKGILESIHLDCTPLLLKVKYHYQRVRPFTLAYHFKLPLYPFYSNTDKSPSYPSGHAFMSKIYCEVLGNTFPKYYAPLMELHNQIKESRIALGLHYPSDCEFADYAGTLVINHPEFKKKYKL
jgi:hypothetical protein